MLSTELLALTLAALAAANPVFASTHPHEYRNVHNHGVYPISPRNYITPETKRDSYDYIIAGGGLAGLVLASRLTDDGKTTVLVLEAGDTGDDEKDKINHPGLTYFTSLLGTKYDYAYKTVEQAGAGGRSINWPRGKILGGSSAVNGMYLVRPNSGEIDAWHDLIADSSNKAYADFWTWDKLYESMKKSENFAPPTDDAQKTAGMKYKTDSHGTSGRLHATFPAYFVPMSSAWLPTLEAAGIPSSEDAYSGNNLGGFFSTMAINPTNWTRSYAKSAYIDSLPPRDNLHILANAAVTKILFADNVQDGNQVASGVQFAKDKDDTPQTVSAAKEVILAGGAVGSPQMLLVSGVGPKDVLDSANIPVKVNLPGVGQHLQDHLATGISWSTTADTQGTIYDSGSDFSKSDEFLSFVNSGTSYVNGSFLFDGDANFANLLKEAKDILGDNTKLEPLIPSKDSDVVAGYKAIYQAYVDKVLPSSGLVEILFSINSAGRITIQAALQTPLSQGRLTVNSASIFDAPVLDPQYFSHPADVVVLRQALKHIRQLATFSPLKELVGDEVSPGKDVQSDADFETYVRNSVSTEFHPGCTCAMLPKEKGGVVDASMKVYGTANLRVIDGSVFPLSMSAHLMAPIYGMAERAAEFILNPPSTSTGSSTTTSGGTQTTTTNNDTKGGKNAAVSVSGGRAVWVALASVAAGAFLCAF
ncbi:hypothetical protein D9611_005962 [Ephemerocybe angulata]|uniref:pyranose dehydrogenase (acceptor) n=1 Tax=Ephemerocybe angulata TaxID=980116 RepID=A0A8H5CG56_9AGAR|nr:hypothetical protein D9611_005962 [Tulosesus angulatus]